MSRLWRCYSAYVQCFISISFAFLQVQKIDIGYAKTAKKMDVKKLKSAMWGLLTPQMASETRSVLKYAFPASLP